MLGSEWKGALTIWLIWPNLFVWFGVASLRSACVSLRNASFHIDWQREEDLVSFYSSGGRDDGSCGSRIGSEVCGRLQVCVGGWYRRREPTICRSHVQPPLRSAICHVQCWRVSLFHPCVQSRKRLLAAETESRYRKIWFAESLARHVESQSLAAGNRTLKHHHAAMLDHVHNCQAN